MGRPTIRDVAALAGVSIATVSYVLNGTGSVSKVTAQRVRECVDELGYRINGVAVAHRTGRSRTIGLAVANITNPFLAKIAQGVHRVASTRGYAVFLVDAQDSQQHEVDGVERLADRVPEGLIWYPVGEGRLSVESFSFPTVVLGREIPGVDSVMADVERGGRLQAEYLISHEHHRIGILSGPQWSDAAELRRVGLEDRLTEEVRVVWEHSLDYSYDIPAVVGRHILSQEVSCVVTANDLQALSLLQLYSRVGLRVPEDVSIIGFDDIDTAGQLTPPLTTVQLPTRQLGATAASLVLDRIEDPGLPARREVLPVRMIVRDSLRQL